MLFLSTLLHRIKERIRMVGIKELIRPHEGDEVLGFTQIDDIMRPAGDHVDGFDLVTADLKADLLIRVDIALFDQRRPRRDIHRDHPEKDP